MQRVKQSVLAIRLFVSVCQHKNRQIQRYRAAHKPNQIVKDWLHFASNRLARPTSITNTVFSLATPINSTHCKPRAQPSTLCK
jgi:hypothetical protein